MDIFQLFHRRFHSYLILIWINILEYKTMAVGNLFKYKTTYELTLSDSGKRMTGPMYNNTIKIHKGINDKKYNTNSQGSITITYQPSIFQTNVFTQTPRTSSATSATYGSRVTGACYVSG